MRHPDADWWESMTGQEIPDRNEMVACPGCGMSRMTAEVEAGVPCDVDECPEGES